MGWKYCVFIPYKVHSVMINYVASYCVFYEFGLNNLKSAFVRNKSFLVSTKIAKGVASGGEGTGAMPPIYSEQKQGSWYL